MDHGKILHFVTEKIEDLGGAIFYSYSKSPLKINNTIIHSSRMDNFGALYFFIKRTPPSVSEFEKEFPAGLNYFKKGKNYFLNVYGKARIINDPEELANQTELTEEETANALSTHLLIKVNILKVDFYDNEYEKKNIVFKKISSIYSKLSDSIGVASHSYNFTPPASIHNFGLQNVLQL